MAEEKQATGPAGTPLHLDESNFDQTLTANGNVVVDFWATWCMPCRMLAPVIDSLAKKMQGSVVFGKVNVDEAGNLASRFGVMSIPTLIVFSGGKKVTELVGSMPEGVLEEKLRAALNLK